VGLARLAKWQHKGHTQFGKVGLKVVGFGMLLCPLYATLKLTQKDWRGWPSGNTKFIPNTAR
jgi:hypothetical protein